ncbi:hypothetical protein EBZ80_02390 [bacterium]|nr:hypothetical protein [bacterium]
MEKSLEALVRKNTKAQLVKTCREKGFAVTGTKHDLAGRLLGVTKDQPIVEKIQIVIRIVKNEHGNYCHDESKLVFDTNKKVIGVQLPDGRVRGLTREDILECHKYKFGYVMPVRLDPDPDLVSEPIPAGSDGEAEEGEEEDE